MAHAGKSIQHPAADTLGRGVRRQQLRVCNFQRLQFLEQPVVFGIGNFSRASST
jgi:hypothetical protein